MRLSSRLTLGAEYQVRQGKGCTGVCEARAAAGAVVEAGVGLLNGAPTTRRPLPPPLFARRSPTSSRKAIRFLIEREKLTRRVHSIPLRRRSGRAGTGRGGPLTRPFIKREPGGEK